nr:hypothetical protein CFP56_04172 [Quercus suber]
MCIVVLFRARVSIRSVVIWKGELKTGQLSRRNADSTNCTAETKMLLFESTQIERGRIVNCHLDRLLNMSNAADPRVSDLATIIRLVMLIH